MTRAAIVLLLLVGSSMSAWADGPERSKLSGKVDELVRAERQRALEIGRMAKRLALAAQRMRHIIRGQPVPVAERKADGIQSTLVIDQYGVHTKMGGSELFPLWLSNRTAREEKKVNGSTLRLGRTISQMFETATPESIEKAFLKRFEP